jgi:hypothetical protein
MIVGRSQSGNLKKQKRKDTHTIRKDNVIEMKKPEASFDDPIGDILRQGPRELLAKALQVEVASFMALYADLKDVQCRQRVTHNGWYLPEGKFKPVLDQFED